MIVDELGRVERSENKFDLSFASDRKGCCLFVSFKERAGINQSLGLF